MSKLTTLKVNFGFDLLQRLSGLAPSELEKQEGNLDHALDQAMQKHFGNIETMGTAFYAYNEDYLIEAYDEDGNLVESLVNTDILEKIAKEAIATL